MPKGLPDSMTYTMSKRVMRIARDKNTETADRFDDGVQAAAFFIWGTVRLLEGLLWVVVSPIIFLGWLAQKELDRIERKKAREDKKARYAEAVARRSRKK